MTCKQAACVLWRFFVHNYFHIWFFFCFRCSTMFVGSWKRTETPSGMTSCLFSRTAGTNAVLYVLCWTHTQTQSHLHIHLFCSTPLAGSTSSMTCLSMLVAETETKPWKWALHDESPPSALSSGWDWSFWWCWSGSVSVLIVVSSNGHSVLLHIIMALLRASGTKAVCTKWQRGGWNNVAPEGEAEWSQYLIFWERWSECVVVVGLQYRA